MNILSKNAFLGLVVLSISVLATSCDKDGDGDGDFGDKCYECTDMSNNQSDVLCEDNFEDFVDTYNVQNPGNFEGFIDNVEGLPNIECEVKLF